MLLEKTTRVVLTDFKTVLFRIQLVPCLWIRKAKNKNRFFDWSAISNYIRDLWTVNNALKRPSQFWGITGWGSFSVWKFRIKRYFKSTYSFVKFRLAIGTMTEINQLRIALQESATARNITEGQCISLKVDCLCCLNYKNENWGQLFFLGLLLLLLWSYIHLCIESAYS